MRLSWLGLALGGRPRSLYVSLMKPDLKAQTELEAAAFRRLVAHLQARSDVQNLDLMNLAGFCRNCLSNWYEEAAQAKGLAVTRAQAREYIYGMPQEEWKAKYQTGEQKPLTKPSH
jgi:uncharacterized protein